MCHQLLRKHVDKYLLSIIKTLTAKEQHAKVGKQPSVFKTMKIPIGSHVKFLKCCARTGRLFLQTFLFLKRKRNSQRSQGHPSEQASFKPSILSFYTANLAQISNRKETYVYHLKTRKTSHCKTAVSEISVFKSDTVLKQQLSY